MATEAAVAVEIDCCPRQVAGYWEDPLWIRIAGFPLDDPKAKLTFSRRLARDNGWSCYYACRVIAEYKRFCYLALVAGHPVTPSEEVDQAWHLHLLYTRNYWDDFCREVLHQPLHHGPTRGGLEEQVKFREWYTATIESYARLFGSSPPSDIWPAAEVRFAISAFRRIDTASNWILPKPRFPFLRLR
jgi:hypothetical protein